MRLYVLPAIGDTRLDVVTHRDVQGIADRILAAGRTPSSVRNAILPVRVLYRRAVRDGTVSTSPCDRIELPAVRGGRDRIVSPEEAQRLLSVLSSHDRAFWGCAFYAGLRRGEIRALLWEHVDLAAGLIRVEAGWDEFEGRITPKSRAGVRQVIIVAALRDHLTEHAVSETRDPAGFVFPGTRGVVVNPASVIRRTHQAWAAAGLDRVGLHDARHTCASIFIAAGMNPKALSEMLGHSSIAVTYDVYGHLMPGARDEARELVDAYLERAVR